MILLGLRKKVNIYETFIEGAKEGFSVAITIIPYLVAMLVAIGVFRASGAMDYFTDGMKWVLNYSRISIPILLMPCPLP